MATREARGLGQPRGEGHDGGRAAHGRPDAPPCPAEAPEALRGERRDAAENRRRILAAARALFAERGVDAVSMNQIARAAGIGPGTLYRRYAHKGLLCQGLLEENTGRFREETAARLAPGPAAGPALARLEAVLLRLIAFNEENAPLLGAIADAACGDRRGAIYGGPLYQWLYRIVLATVEEALAAGELAPLDAAWLADALLAPLAIDLYLFQRHERGFTPERIAAAVRQFLASLRAGQPVA